MAEPVHTPVLLNEVLALLEPQPGARVIDATVDGGGHAAALLQKIEPGGRLLGIDRDPSMIAALQQRLGDALTAGSLTLASGSFRKLAEIAASRGFSAANAILFDLGLSSHHLDGSGRGFSFQRDEPLDLRFDPGDSDIDTAAEILAHNTAEELTSLFRDLGEERFASRIARSIVAQRERAPIERTQQLFDIIVRVLPGRERQRAGRSAARVFQALRIAVNQELTAVRETLPQAIDLLRPGGRLAVISFHSLEDRIVKHYFAEARREGRVSVLTKRPIRPGDAEILSNPRSASAKLRVAEKR